MVDVNEARVMTGFLLGDLGPAEREAVEERLTADPEYFVALCAREDEMLLEWHRGELSDVERRLFSQSYASSPARRARVASAQDLIEATKEWTAAEAADSRVRNRVRQWLATPRPIPRFRVVGAVGLLVMAVSMAVYETGDVKRRLQLVERENTELRQRVARARSLAVIFPLAPLGERGQSPGEMNRVQIPREADEVWLQFETADPGTALGLDAILEPLGGSFVAMPRPVRVARTATTALVTLTVAARDLPRGDYMLRLRQVTGLSSNIIATRAFRVTRE